MNLTLEQKEYVYNFVDRGKYGDCYQDKYIDILSSLMSVGYNGSSAILNPVILYDRDYRFTGNYRKIVDDTERDNESKTLFLYFEYPLPASELYLGVMNTRMIFPLTRAVSMIGAQCESTSIIKAPFTLCVNIEEFKDIWENNNDELKDRCISGFFVNKSVITSSKMKYLSDVIRNPEDLFEVIQLPYKLF